MMSPARKRLAAWVAAALLVAGCGRGASPDRETLTIASRADVTGFFPSPSMQHEAFTIELNAHLFEGLVRFDRDLKPVPALAESWLNLDERTWRFRLREGVTFSNGAPVRAEDVVASLRAILERPLASAAMLSAIEAVTTPEPRVVEIRTRSSSPFLLARLTAGFVVPEAHARGAGENAPGSGPYALESWRPGAEIVLARNERYWGRRPAFRRLRWVVSPDGEERIQNVIRGRAQVADHVPLSRIDALRKAPDLRVVTRPGLRVLFLGFA